MNGFSGWLNRSLIFMGLLSFGLHATRAIRGDVDSLIGAVFSLGIAIYGMVCEITGH